MGGSLGWRGSSRLGRGPQLRGEVAKLTIRDVARAIALPFAPMLWLRRDNQRSAGVVVSSSESFLAEMQFLVWRDAQMAAITRQLQREFPELLGRLEQLIADTDMWQILRSSAGFKANVSGLIDLAAGAARSGHVARGRCTGKCNCTCPDGAAQLG